MSKSAEVLAGIATLLFLTGGALGDEARDAAELLRLSFQCPQKVDASGDHEIAVYTGDQHRFSIKVDRSLRNGLKDTYTWAADFDKLRSTTVVAYGIDHNLRPNESFPASFNITCRLRRNCIHGTYSTGSPNDFNEGGIGFCDAETAKSAKQAIDILIRLNSKEDRYRPSRRKVKGFLMAADEDMASSCAALCVGLLLLPSLALADEASEATHSLVASFGCQVPPEEPETNGYIQITHQYSYFGNSELFRLRDKQSEVTISSRGRETNNDVLEYGARFSSIGEVEVNETEVVIDCRDAQDCFVTNSSNGTEKESELALKLCDNKTASTVKRAIDLLRRLSRK